MCEDNISLKDYESFVTVRDGKRHYYGGNQQWFNSGINRKSGCGAVVAANITALIAKEKELHNLYKYKDYSRTNFLQHMNEVIKYVIPKENVGILQPKIFAADVVSFALSRGVLLKESIKYFEEGYNSISGFIKKSLKENKPIALLMLRNERLKEFDWHWMTITKYYKNDFNTYVNVSTWGERRILKLDEVFKYSSYGAVINFTIS